MGGGYTEWSHQFIGQTQLLDMPTPTVINLVNDYKIVLKLHKPLLAENCATYLIMEYELKSLGNSFHAQ